MIENNWSGTEVLITGGTGSLGKTLVKKLLKEKKPHGIRIYSRDELKQWQLKKELADEGFTGNVSFLLGDIRDYKRLKLATENVDLIINTAAMKQVGACEENPMEAIKTNVDASANIVSAALENNVANVMHISTDKAVYPVNLYGMTKAVAEKVFQHANIYSGGHKKTQFNCCRYGNVLGSRGSIIPLFRDQLIKNAKLTLTSPEMTRFFIPLCDVVDFIIDRIEDEMIPGAIYIPKMKTTTIKRMVDFIIEKSNKDIEIEIIGVGPGEKIHECLITHEESISTISNGLYFEVLPRKENVYMKKDTWEYKSNNKMNVFSDCEIKEIIEREF